MGMHVLMILASLRRLESITWGTQWYTGFEAQGMPRRMTNTFTVPRYSPHVHRPVPRARENSKRGRTSKEVPSKCRNNGSKRRCCPVTRAPVTKSAMTRNMGKSIAEIILTDRRKKSSRENQRMGLENGTLRQPVKKSIPKTRPAQPSNLSPVNQSSRANRTRSPHVAFALASSRIEYEQASKPSDQAPIIHKHINRSAGRGHHRESP
jgi:hypothetical protein